MLEEFKKALYFPLASYFRFFANVRLRRWNPIILVVTGSNGKTTLLHLLESQIGSKAKFSHHANSSYGIPFDILDLHRKTLHKMEWIGLFLKAPFMMFAKIPRQKLYVVEADADRAGEGKFLAELLKPHIVLWVSTGTTHSVNYDLLVQQGIFDTAEEAIAHEYGYFVEKAKKLVIIDVDSKLQRLQKPRTKAEIREVTKERLKKYKIDAKGTHFRYGEKEYSFEALLPEVFYLSLGMCLEVCDYLQIPVDENFSKFVVPPGRGTILSGTKKTVLIDSSYNGNRNSIDVMLSMFDTTPFTKKWVVLGDMLELGNEEKREHQLLANTLQKSGYDRVILVGKICRKYMKDILQKEKKVVLYDYAKDALHYIQENITGGEAILFKGSQSIFLEGIIEQLLADKKDAEKLPRRGDHWEAKRRSRGL